MLQDLRHDLTFASRSLRKNPSFTAVAVAALALGIGANTTVWSVVSAMLSFPLRIVDPDRVCFVFATYAEREIHDGPVSMDDYLDWREQTRSFQDLAAVRDVDFNLVGAGEPARVAGLQVASGFFTALGRPLALGRDLRAQDSLPGAEPVVVLTHGLWQELYAGRHEVIGQTLVLDGRSHIVVGVSHEKFFFGGDPRIITPLALGRGSSERDQRSLFVVGRLKEGITSAQATVELRTLAERLAAAHPRTNAGWSARAETAREGILAGVALATTVLYGSITFVLLIACANVANLLLSRASVREREIALRTALGAGRSRLIRQLLTESLLLALVGGGLGLLLGLVGMQILRNMIAVDVNIGFLADSMHPNGAILLHTMGVSMLSALVFGLAPALQISRPDLNVTLREGGRGAGAGARGRRLRAVLVLGEVTLALALLGTTGALIRAFDHIYRVAPGFEPAGLLTGRVALTELEYPEPQQVAQFYREARRRLSELPGSVAATTTSQLPLTLRPGTLTTSLSAEGAGGDAEDRSPNAIHTIVSPHYFEALGVAVVSGRALGEHDSEQAPLVAVVSETAARRFWPGAEPLGKRFQLEEAAGAAPWITVVGVAADLQMTVHSLRFFTERQPVVFLPEAQHPQRTTFLVLRAAVDPASLAQPLRQAIWQVDPKQPVDGVLTMEQVIARIDTQNLVFVRVLSGLSLAALLLAGLGIYGVISFAAGQRRREIGIRVALGAQPRSILLLVVRQAAVVTLLGLILGAGLSFAFVRLIGSELEGIARSPAGGPATFVAVSLVLLLVAQLASYLPARRALRSDPVEALRHE